MSTRNRTRVNTFISGSVEAVAWEHAEHSGVTYSVTVSGAAKSLVPVKLADIRTVTAQAETWIKSHTG
jgi:hypothetical protein